MNYSVGNSRPFFRWIRWNSFALLLSWIYIGKLRSRSKLSSFKKKTSLVNLWKEREKETRTQRNSDNALYGKNGFPPSNISSNYCNEIRIICYRSFIEKTERKNVSLLFLSPLLLVSSVLHSMHLTTNISIFYHCILTNYILFERIFHHLKKRRCFVYVRSLSPLDIGLWKACACTIFLFSF